MPKYVVHVGPSKTGTTYLQASLNFTRTTLLGNGICYPRDWWRDKPTLNHEFLVERLRGAPDAQLEEGFRELNDSDFRLVVLSFEGFPTLSRAQLEGFKKLLGGSEVEIVFYCRRWSDRLPSAWQQVVRGGSTSGFPDFFAKLMANPHRSAAVNPAVLLDKFAAVFGKPNVRIISYNNVLQRKQDLFKHFCRTILDVDYVGPLPPAKKNEAFNMFDTEIYRVINLLEENEAEKYKGNLLRRFGAVRPRVDLTDVTTRMKDYVSEVRISDRAPVFEGFYEDLMHRYLDNMVDPNEKLGFFRRKARIVQYVRPDYLLLNGSGDAIRAMHKRIRRVP